MLVGETVPSPQLLVMSAYQPAPSTLSEPLPPTTWAPKLLGEPQPIAQARAEALGTGLESSPCSFCRVTSTTLGLTSKACAASQMIWLAGLTVPLMSRAA